MKLTKKEIVLALSIISEVILLFPYAQYNIGGYIYKASAFDLISARGFRLGHNLILIPLATKIALLLVIAIPIIALIFLFVSKEIWLALLYMLGSLIPLMVILSTSVMHTHIAAAGISNFTAKYLPPFVLQSTISFACAIILLLEKDVEVLAKSIFLAFASLSVVFVITITIYIIISGTPAISKIGLVNFIFKSQWKPSQSKYGIFAMILSSVIATLGAVAIGVPIGILTAIFLSELAPKRLANILRPAMQLLAGIPSVVYGFFGMLIIVPIIRNLFSGYTIGDSLLAAIIVLSIMILPTIITITESALKSVPKSYRDAALALGTTKMTTIFKITLPTARSGVVSGVILGVGRAIGETMAVIMVSGNVVNMPRLLGSVRLLTTGIVLEMSYSSGVHRQALFAIGLILFIFIMIVNLSFILISKKGAHMDAK